MTSLLDDEIVMLNVERGNYYGLSGVARRIWEQLDTPKTIDEVCTPLVVEYDVTPEQCWNDVAAFVEQLITENVVRVVE